MYSIDLIKQTQFYFLGIFKNLNYNVFLYINLSKGERLISKRLTINSWFVKPLGFKKFFKLFKFVSITIKSSVIIKAFTSEDVLFILNTNPVSITGPIAAYFPLSRINFTL
ncbi:hypothetical protein BpHYR1_025485 [Brachionus plicatilis]|uniref:Uncharacterized protein n=1 Tax=Brachionus plicatilis TaxID=10195 RepID=A0A3M7PAV8_BRAPC|nr:hypothetical protein BpHYR1_025485 [Brachionus plicatilis]